MRTRVQILRNPSYCRVGAATFLESQPSEEEMGFPEVARETSQILKLWFSLRDPASGVKGGSMRMTLSIRLQPACAYMCVHIHEKYAHTHVYTTHTRKKEKE